MIYYVMKPHIPTRQVSVGIVSGENQEALSYIESFGIKTLLTDRNENIDKSISNHADINLYHLGRNKIIADSSQKKLIQKLEKSGFDVSKTENRISGDYPNDCRLNFARIDNLLFGRQDVCDGSIRQCCKADGVKFVNVNQGYSKCSLCIVNERAVITDDISIKQAIGRFGIDCLLISKGDIRLSGHEYGFIGGASALIDKDKLLFFGNLKQHRDFEKIVSFLSDHGCKAVFSQAFDLTDIGGMIPIIEKV